MQEYFSFMNEQNNIHHFSAEQTFIHPADFSVFPSLSLYNLHGPVEGLWGVSLWKENVKLLPYSSSLKLVFEQTAKTGLEFQIWRKSNIVGLPWLKQNCYQWSCLQIPGFFQLGPWEQQAVRCQGSIQNTGLEMYHFFICLLTDTLKYFPLCSGCGDLTLLQSLTVNHVNCGEKDLIKV